MKTELWLLSCCLILAASLHADESDWPRKIEVETGVLTIYQPQPESFVGNTLKARAAISFVSKGEKEPIFGAMWVKATVETDRQARVIRLVGAIWRSKA